MERIQELMLQAFQASLQKQTVTWEQALTPEQWHQLFAAASQHHILPMVYEAVVRSRAARESDQQIFMTVKKQIRYIVSVQTIKTNTFLKLLNALQNAGVTPLVVKGIVCRELYPKPDYRFSADEDLLIPKDQFTLCHETMLQFGLVLKNPEQNLDDFEITYVHNSSNLHIELHKMLFHPDSEAYNHFNCFFADVQSKLIYQSVQGVQVPTMNHSDHLFYLICHSFKHFLHSGFGIRQVCDICLYANAYGDQIDWIRILRQCEEIHADRFAAALFKIGEKYLTFHPEMACYSPEWKKMEIDESPMLMDLMDSGVYGRSSMSRTHSSSMTLNAVSACKQGKTRGQSVIKTIFPTVKDLSGRYPYLKKKPYLLPVAWMDRIVKYKLETAGAASSNSASESLKIGNQRIDLLRRYGIIDL